MLTRMSKAAAATVQQQQQQQQRFGWHRTQCKRVQLCKQTRNEASYSCTIRKRQFPICKVSLHSNTMKDRPACSLTDQTQGAAASPVNQRRGLQLQVQSARSPAAAGSTSILSVIIVLHQSFWTEDAIAATVCVDVPDWLVDWRSAVFHSPVLAVGAAGLALVLFPKLIRTAINYLAIPAILAMLAYAAVSFPEQTANSIYTVLEFIKEHPTASSIGIVAAAGVLLGPDLLAGTAVAGALALLAVNLGILQFPSLPSLPKVPGQALVTRQLNKAGQAFKDRLDDLDDLDDAVDKGRRAAGSSKNTYKASSLSLSDSSSSVGPATTNRQLEVKSVTAASDVLAASEAEVDAGSSLQVPPAPAVSPPLQQPAGQQQEEGLRLPPVPGLSGFKGLAQQLGSAASSIGATAAEQGKAAGSSLMQQGKQVQASGKLQELSHQTAEVADKAAERAKQVAGGLWQRTQQLQAPQVLQKLKGDTASALGQVRGALQGQADTGNGSYNSSNSSGSNSSTPKLEPDIDSILANS